VECGHREQQIYGIMAQTYRFSGQQHTCSSRTILSTGLVPQPLISREFILTEIVSLNKIEILKKNEVKGLGDITPPKIQITSRELSFRGINLHLPQSMLSF
jgi:hypothetical protein